MLDNFHIDVYLSSTWSLLWRVIDMMVIYSEDVGVHFTFFCMGGISSNSERRLEYK